MQPQLKQAVLAVSVLVLCASATTQSIAQNGRGQDNAATVDATAGVGRAGEPVVLRPSGPVPGQFIVVFQDSVTNPRGLANALARQNGIELRGVYSTALKGFAARMPDAVAERLALDPNVAYVERDVYAHADDLVTGIDRIDADLNIAAGIGFGLDVNVDVAVIDSGIHPHADLNISGFYDCRGGCGATETDPFDDNGHGTHVAGSIGARDNGPNVGGITEVVGVAPGARLWGFKVLDSEGSGFISDIISAVDKVTELGNIKVANMSLGGQGFIASFHTAIQNSVDIGVVHVVAAGNSRSDVYGPDGMLAESASFSCLLLGRNCPDDFVPASYPEAMTVSAMADFDGTDGGLTDQTVGFSSCTHTGDDVFACFTNYSGSVDASNPVDSPGGAIDVAGPGLNILSTFNNDGYATYSGTSMASPHVAGAVALCIVEDCAGLGGPPMNATDVAAIRQAIIDGAQPQTAWGPPDTKDPDGNAEGLVYVGGPAPDLVDAAITLVTAPSPVEIDTTQTVTVDVTNNSTQEKSFTVSLSDSLTATISADQSVTLASGASTTLNFSWTPTEIGDHTLTGSHGLAGDDNDTNDTATTSVTVSDPVLSVFVVDSVCYSGAGGKQSNKHLISTVSITDGTTALSGATVSARVEDGTGSSRSGTGTTDSAGEVQFSWKNADFSETYTTVVESVNGDLTITAPDNEAMWDEDIPVCFPEPM